MGMLFGLTMKVFEAVQNGEKELLMRLLVINIF
jgi:hypothetical protein